MTGRERSTGAEPKQRYRSWIVRLARSGTPIAAADVERALRMLDSEEDQ
jgi:hypothetical protein